MDLRKEINIINNERLPNSNRTDRLIQLFEKYAESLQLLKADVSSAVCENMNENRKCKLMCLTRCIENNRFI